jgi:hypothetical protein
LGVPGAVLARARRAARSIGDGAARLGGAVAVDADEVLTGRAGLLGIAPAGRVSAGGATHLLPTRDGWCALTLSRDEDVETVPALLESDDRPSDPWAAVSRAAAGSVATAFVARARLLDLPAAVLGEARPATPRIVRSAPPVAAPRMSELLVADLSSMWAGPLCGQLLAAAGATVVKVESVSRPDGTRRGDRRFFDWMNASKLCYATEFRDADVRRLLEVADVVIEASRPAALARRGLSPERLQPRPGRVWLRITGYGAAEGCAHQVAFGDDAAVAGGLVAPGPAFAGDAIADPLTGLDAMLAVLDSLGRGGGETIDIALAEVAADYAAGCSSLDSVGAEPRIPAIPNRAAALGADNSRVLELIESRLATC